MKKTPSRRRISVADEKAEAMFVANDGGYAGRVLPPNVRAEENARKEWTPGERAEIFKKNRDLNEGNPFVGSWCQVRRIFFDDDLRFVGEDDALKKWLDDKGVRALVKGLNADIWSEWLLQDNVVVFWMTPKGKGQLPQPMVMDCEACQYTNDLAGEVLKMRVPKRNLSQEEKAKLGPRWAEAYAKGQWITVDPEQGENFAVLTRAKAGKGFAKPRLRQAYPLLGTLDNLHTGDFGGSFQAKDVIHHIKVGREMKFQDALSKPEYFTISKKEKQQIEKEIANKRGAYRAVTDIKVAFAWAYMDPKYFNAEKYKGTIEQLDRWGGAGMMLLATGKEWLLPFFRAEGCGDRRDVGGFIGRLLADRNFLPAKPTKPLAVDWNPNTFRDFGAVVEMLRFAVGQGVMSNTTAREYLSLDDKLEGDRLTLEKKSADRYRPTFEAKQGMLSLERGGRPPKDAPQA